MIFIIELSESQENQNFLCPKWALIKVYRYLFWRRNKIKQCFNSLYFFLSQENIPFSQNSKNFAQELISCLAKLRKFHPNFVSCFTNIPETRKWKFCEINETNFFGIHPNPKHRLHMVSIVFWLAVKLRRYSKNNSDSAPRFCGSESYRDFKF